MSKPIVHYRGPVHFIPYLGSGGGERAVLTPIDHTNHLEGQDVSNDEPAITSRVVEKDIDTGRIETRNTIYLPEAA